MSARNYIFLFILNILGELSVHEKLIYTALTLAGSTIFSSMINFTSNMKTTHSLPILTTHIPYHRHKTCSSLVHSVLRVNLSYTFQYSLKLHCIRGNIRNYFQPINTQRTKILCLYHNLIQFLHLLYQI